MNEANGREMTLGERLQQQALQLMHRRAPTLSWLPLVEDTLERNVRRVGPSPDRWQRVEIRRPLQSPPVMAEGLLEEATDETRLPGDLLRQLRGMWGRQRSDIRIHEGPVARAMTQAHHAAAVTVGNQIYLGQIPGGHRDQRGPLIIHELTHVQHALDPHAAWDRMTTAGIQREERSALRQERIAARSPLVPVTAPAPPPTSPPSRNSLPVSASSPIARPMKADVGRDLSSESAPVPAPVSAGGSGSHERLMQELMLRMRTDFERGG